MVRISSFYLPNNFLLFHNRVSLTIFNRKFSGDESFPDTGSMSQDDPFDSKL